MTHSLSRANQGSWSALSSNKDSKSPVPVTRPATALHTIPSQQTFWDDQNQIKEAHRMIGANGLIARRRPLMLSTCRMLSGKSRARHADLPTHLVS